MMDDHYYELRLEGMQPSRHRTLQGAMAKALLQEEPSGGIWQVIEEGDEPAQVVRYERGQISAVPPFE